jgi:hypothetical protein
MRDRQRHRRQAFGGRVDDNHRVALPWRRGGEVAHAAPDVDDLLAADPGAAGAAGLAAPSEVLFERVAYCLEAGADVSLDRR